jgi:hypothetical protein
MEEKGNLFDLMLAELESYTTSSVDVAVEPSICLELELRKFQLMLIPYLRLGDSLREQRETVSKKLLQVGQSWITVQDIYDLQCMFDQLGLLCVHIRALECKKV